jgi:hypothetical protein
LGEELNTSVIDSGCPTPHPTPRRKDAAASAHAPSKRGSRQNATAATNIA